MEDSPINKTYRLTLDFTVWMNDEILHPYSDEDELDVNLVLSTYLLMSLFSSSKWGTDRLFWTLFGESTSRKALFKLSVGKAHQEEKTT